jgi:hypothetical protein
LCNKLPVMKSLMMSFDTENILQLIMSSQLMLAREIITIYCGNYTKHINTLCGQDVEFFSVKYRYHFP